MIHIDIELVEFPDPEQNKQAEAHYYAFLDWLNAQRRKAQSDVVALYPRLGNGVSAQEIQRVTEDAAYWAGIPDEMAGMYAYEAVKSPVQYARHKLLAEALEITVYEFWLDLNYEPENDDDTEDETRR